MGSAGEEGSGRNYSRRSFLELAGGAFAAACLTELGALRASPAEAHAALATATDVTVDTFKALVAFVVPGDDPYSVAQGETVAGPGGVASGTVPYIMATLDKALALSLSSIRAGLPASQAAAGLLNEMALTVDPAAVVGPFSSPFARLSFEQKGRVFAALEQEGENNELGYVVGAGLALVGLVSYSEAAVFDPAKRRLTGRPVGWTISGFPGPAEGRAEFRGYWRGHKTARPSSRCTRGRPSLGADG